MRRWLPATIPKSGLSVVVEKWVGIVAGGWLQALGSERREVAN